MSTMTLKATFEDFVREEELNEQRRQTERREREAKKELEAKQKAESDRKRLESRQSYDERKAAQRAQLERIMDEATKRHAEDKKKVYGKDQFVPPTGPVAWLVFDRATGELYGEATKLRAHQAWDEVNPTRLVLDPARPDRETLVAVGFNACRCVQRSEWEAAEARIRARKSNGSNGAGR